MTRNEVLKFENDSGQFMRLVFVEPQEQADRIRCYPIDHRIGRPAQAPWMLFDWGPGGRLTATIPAGRVWLQVEGPATYCRVGYALGDQRSRTGDAPVKAARDEHRACAAGNLHRMLLDVSHATASHRDLQSLLRDLAGLLRRVARFDRLAIVLHDPERDVMRLHTIVSLEPTFTTDLELPVPESPAGLVWQTQRPLVVPRIDRETRFAEVRRILRAEGMRSLCILPLTTPLRRLGRPSFARPAEAAFSDSDVEVLQELTSQVALAVDNTLHHEAAHRGQEES